jgi:hypothetical protein
LPRTARVLFVFRLAALTLTVVLRALIALSNPDGPAQLLVRLVTHPTLVPAALIVLLVAVTPAVTHMALSALIVKLIPLPALAALVILLVALHALLVTLAVLFILALLIPLLTTLRVFALTLILVHEDLPFCNERLERNAFRPLSTQSACRDEGQFCLEETPTSAGGSKPVP